MNNSHVILLSAYFLVVILFVAAKSFYLSNKAIYLLRAFFPSWKFFEEFGEVPILFFRFGTTSTDLGPWQPCLEKPERKWSALFLNSHGNFILACNSIVQQLVSDLNELDDQQTSQLEQSVSYRLIKQLVLFQIEKNRGHERGFQFQFKVCAVLPSAPTNEHSTDDVLISPVYEA